MKFLKRLTCIMAVVFVVSCMLSALYIFRPDIADKFGAFLYPEQKSAEMATSNTPDESTEKKEKKEEEETKETEEETEEHNTEEYETDETETPKDDAIGESVVSDYILPEQSELDVPEHVSGRNGYQQIQENGEQIDEEAAEELQNQIDTGYTGDGLDFDSIRYPYYAMLNPKFGI